MLALCQIHIGMYRVSINSFPDYRHLLLENYVEYKHIFSPLLQLVSKILYYVFVVTFGFWMQHFKKVDWERRSDTLATTITGYHPLNFFLWRYIKDKVFSTPVPDITYLKARITDAFATITEDMLETHEEKLIVD